MITVKGLSYYGFEWAHFIHYYDVVYTIMIIFIELPEQEKHNMLADAWSKVTTFVAFYFIYLSS